MTPEALGETIAKYSEDDVARDVIALALMLEAKNGLVELSKFELADELAFRVAKDT